MSKQWNHAQSRALVDLVSYENEEKSRILSKYLFLDIDRGMTEEMKALCREYVDKEERPRLRELMRRNDDR